MNERSDVPALGGVLETVLYYDDQDEAETFYSDVLGMRLIAKQPGRSLFFRAGESVYLMFDPAAAQKGGELPPHGANGPGHVCFVVDPEQYQEWKEYLTERGVTILKEMQWPGRRDSERLMSFYFRDPSGNLLEIADGDLWQS